MMFVCYCFEYTQENIELDVREHGTSTILARILAEKKDGRCECATKNPKGT